MSVVQITNGFYRNQEVTGIFPVIQEMKEAKDGSTFITVDGSATEFDKAKMRVKVKPENVKVLSEHTETDEQVMDRIAERFSILDEMTQNPLLASKQRGTPREFPAQRRAEFQSSSLTKWSAISWANLRQRVLIAAMSLIRKPNDNRRLKWKH